SSFVYDTTAPTATVSFPANNSHYNAAGWNSTLSGTATDASSSVATVKLSIQKDGGATACWDGPNAAGHFTAACPNYVTATGTTSWSTTLGSAALVDGSSYAIIVETIDNATNTDTAAATASWTYDNSAPTATVSFPANNSHYNAAGWNSTLSGTAADTSSSVATVKLSIQKDGGATPAGTAPTPPATSPPPAPTTAPTTRPAGTAPPPAPPPTPAPRSPPSSSRSRKTAAPTPAGTAPTPPATSPPPAPTTSPPPAPPAGQPPSAPPPSSTAPATPSPSKQSTTPPTPTPTTPPPAAASSTTTRRRP